MFHTKDHKTGYMFEPFGYMGPKRMGRMKRSWAELFRTEILAELPVDRLRRHYDATQGRPSKELYAVLGAVILQQMLDLTDEETVDQFAFNLQWHYALDITGESDQAAYLCPKTLWSVRSLLMNEEVAAEMFDVVTDKLKRVFEVDTQQQRLDSMHIFSNMRHLGRVRLLAQTIRKFLVNLKRHHRERFEALPQEMRQRYMSAAGEGVFGLVKPSESGRTLQMLGEDLLELIESFGQEAAISGMHSYRLLVRVFSEQCRVEPEETKGADKVEVKANREVPSDSLQNPSDPDASYDHYKGKGYQVQVMESYGEEGEASEAKKSLNLITYVQAEGAHESDSQAVEPALEKSRQQQRAPHRLLADSLYGSDNNHVYTQAEGVELIAPVKTNKVAPPVGLADFTYDNLKRVTACPQGQAPLSTYGRKQRHSARFDRAVCAKCPLQEQCPVQPGGRGNYLRYSHKELRIEQRKAYQQTDEFRDRYRFRCGCEATMSELDRRTGLKRLRVRGMSAVSFCVYLKAAGVNILRASRFRNLHLRPENSINGSIFSRFQLFGLDQRWLGPWFRAFSQLLARLMAEFDDEAILCTNSVR